MARRCGPRRNRGDLRWQEATMRCDTRSGGRLAAGAVGVLVAVGLTRGGELPPQPASAPASTPLAPAAADQPLPIDLPTALRLVDANSPTVALARARIDQAYARQRQAEVYYLPTLLTGVN